MSAAISEPIWLDPLVTFLAVIVGGFVSYWVTTAAERAQRKIIDEATAYKLISQLSAITNDLCQLNGIFRRISLEHFNELNAGAELWQLIPKSFGWDRSIQIDPDAQVLLVKAGRVDLLSKLEEAESAHRLYTAAAKKVGRLKDQLRDKAASRSVGHGRISLETKTPEEHAKVMPLVIELETLSGKLGYNLAEAAFSALELARELPVALKDGLRLKNMISLELPNDFDDQDFDILQNSGQ